MKILMIEDDLDLGRALLSILTDQSIECQWLRRIQDAPIDFDDCAVDAVLLDLSLPDGEGHALLAQWRQKQLCVPVIIMTARAALNERLRGLDGGADDFLIKPFAPLELIARLRAVVRRSAMQASETWNLGALQIEPNSRLVRLNGTTLALTPREFDILVELARLAGRVVSKDTLSARLEPFGEPVGISTLDVHVFNLRRKVGAERIRTVRGVGYLFNP